MKWQFHSFTLYPRETQTYHLYTKFCTGMFMAALFTIAQDWRQQKYLSMVYQYYRTLLSSKNEWTTDTHNNLDEFPGNYCEGEKLISQSCIFEMTKFLKTVSRSVVGTGWWRGRVWEGRVCCCIDKRATGRILVVMDLHWGGEYTNLHVIKSYITKYIPTNEYKKNENMNKVSGLYPLYYPGCDIMYVCKSYHWGKWVKCIWVLCVTF